MKLYEKMTNREDAKLKKILISFLVIGLLVTSTSSMVVQAATTDNTSAATTSNTIKVSLYNIKEIMTENNLDIKILYNKMKIANESYHDALDDYQDYDDEYDDDDEVEEPDAVDESDYDLTTDEGKQAYYDALEAYAEDLEAYNDYQSYLSAKNEYETELDAYKTARDAYETGIEDQVNEARAAYIEYLSDVSARELQENAVKVQQRNIQTYKLQYENGFLSKNEYNKYLQENTTENTSLDELKDAEELARVNLCNTMSISSGKNIIFSTDIKEDLDKVSQINYNDDLGKMLDNNYDIRTANNDIDDLEDEEDDYEDDDQEDIYDYKMDNAEATLKQTINTAKSEFNEQYNTLISSYNTLKNNYDSLNLEKTDYSVAQMQYDYGFISKHEVEDAKIGTDGLDSVNSEYENAKITFYKNYLHYLQMKEGY